MELGGRIMRGLKPPASLRFALCANSFLGCGADGVSFSLIPQLAESVGICVRLRYDSRSRPNLLQ
jgi:hypothetical protein